MLILSRGHQPTGIDDAERRPMSPPRTSANAGVFAPHAPAMTKGDQTRTKTRPGGSAVSRCCPDTSPPPPGRPTAYRFRSVITAATQAGLVRGASGGLCAVGGPRHGLARARIQEFLPGFGDAGGAVAHPLFVRRVVVIGPAGCRAVQQPVHIGVATTCDSEGCQGDAENWSHDIHRSLPTCPAACRHSTASIVPMAPVRPSSPSGMAARSAHPSSGGRPLCKCIVAASGARHEGRRHDAVGHVDIGSQPGLVGRFG